MFDAFFSFPFLYFRNAIVKMIWNIFFLDPGKSYRITY